MRSILILFLLSLFYSCERPALDIASSGTEEEQNNGQLSFTQGDEVDFGKVEVGDNDTRLIGVENTGSSDVYNIAFDNLASQFTFNGGSFPGTSGTCTNTLQAGDSCTVDIIFNPDSKSEFIENFSVSFDTDEGSETDVIDIVGEGIGSGSEDPNFGDDGVATFDSGEDDAVSGGVVDTSTDSLTLVGTVDDGVDSDIQIVKIDENGDLDLAFGEQVIDLGANSEDIAVDVLENASGDFVTTTISDSSAGTSLFNDDGSIDLSYGAGLGTSLITPVVNYVEAPVTTIINNSGTKFLINQAQNTLTNNYELAINMLASDGLLDTVGGVTFGDLTTPGKRIVNIGSGDDHPLTSVSDGDSNLLIGGYTDNGSGYYEAFLASVSQTNGALNSAFGTGGVVILDLCSQGRHSRISKIIRLGSGSIIAVGRCLTPSGHDLVVARLNSDGSLDTSFAGDGLLSVDIVGDDGELVDVEVLSDGSILGLGHMNVAGRRNYCLLKVTPLGVLDTTFGVLGIATRRLNGNVLMKKINLLPGEQRVLLSGTIGLLSDDYLVLKIIL